MKIGYNLRTLGSVARVIAGQSPEGKFYNDKGEGLPFYQGKKEFGERHIGPPTTWTTEVTKVAERGDILMSVRAPVGPINFAQGKICIGRGLAAIRPSNQISPDFLFYQLLFKQNEIAGVEGAVFASINKAGIEAVQIVVPSMEEQHRIVGILDNAFGGIARLKANAEMNLQSTEDLFDSYLDSALNRHSAGYVATVLGAEVDLLAGYAFSSDGYSDAKGDVRLLRGDNIMQGYLRWEDSKRWPASDCAAYSRFALREGDVVLAMDRPWVKAGLKRAQISGDDLPCLQVQRTARLRARYTLREDFLFYLTGSQSFSRHLREVQTGIGVPHISGKQIESFMFMRPPLNEQASIAGKLSDLYRGKQQLAARYQCKLAALDELKNSLLHQAFTGQL